MPSTVFLQAQTGLNLVIWQFKTTNTSSCDMRSDETDQMYR